MASRAVDKGPTAARVAENVRELRETLHLSLSALSDRMRELGRPMLPSGLHKIEKGERRVDADDLVALALALEVSPNRLLLPAGAENDVVLTPGATVAGGKAWAWATGDEPLYGPRSRWESRGPTFLGAFPYREPYQEVNRPHDPPRQGLTFGRGKELEKELAPVMAAIKETGVPLEEVSEYLAAVAKIKTMVGTLVHKRGRTSDGER